ncbi:MAG: protein kinase, partial [Deltaproteobacteria bacterium]|nr:protein kinase [Deltaproteobacteria bacterium]
MAQESDRAAFCPSCLNPVDPDAEVCPCCSAGAESGGWPEDPHVGRSIEDRYRIAQRVSADGMAITFLASSLEDESAVALKMLHPDQAADPAVWQTFVEQIQSAQELDARGFVKILYVGMDMDSGDIPFLVHEIVKGETLAEFLTRDLAFDIPEAIEIGRHVAKAIVEAHERQIVHRHLRPEKVIVLGVRQADPVKILDLGFGCVSPQDEVTTPDLIDALRYMPPEQEEGADDPRTDIYALGVMLYEMIAGQPPPTSKGLSTSAGDLIRMKDLAPSAPDELDLLVHDMMARDPKKRPRSMAMVVSKLEHIDGELSTLTIDSIIPEGAMHVEDPPSVVHKLSAVGKPSPVAKSPAVTSDLSPRRIIGGVRYSAEVFSRPTKPPAGGKTVTPAAARRPPSPVKSPEEVKPPEETGPKKSLAAIFLDKDKDVPDKAASKPGPKKSAKPVPAPPVNPEEVLPHL